MEVIAGGGEEAARGGAGAVSVGEREVGGKDRIGGRGEAEGVSEGAEVGERLGDAERL